MLDLSVTFFINIINIAILYFILKKTLFKPVTEFMEKRSNKIKDDMENAARNKEEAAKMVKSQNQLQEKASEEAKKLVAEARSRAEKEYETIIKNARQEVEDLLKRGREQLEDERRFMMSEAKAEIAGLALAAASKVIEKNMDTEANRKLVNDFIDRAGVA